jgi:ribosome modulation factor
MQQVMAQSRRCHEENSALRLLYKQLKSDGHDVAAMRTAIKYKKLDTDTAVNNIQATIRYSGLLGLPVSPETLFDGIDFAVTERTQANNDIWDAEEGGYQAGRHGIKIDECPYNPGTELFVQWREWWHKGQKAAVMAMGSSTTEVRASPGRRRKQAALPLVPADNVADLSEVRAARKGPGRPRKLAAKKAARRPRRATRTSPENGATVY